MYIVFVSKSSLIVFKMTIISLLLLVSLLPQLTVTARVNVGIVNGTEVEPHSRPFMVSLQKNWRHVCGGFLISGRFVMTAAHCWKNDNLTALVGAHDIRDNKVPLRIGVKSYHVHPKFNKCTLQNDIMLLRLEKEVEQNKNVMKISIPKKEEYITPDTVCSVAGWGRQDSGENSYLLREAGVKVMNNTECKKKWKDKFSASRMMCVYGHGGSCKGDGGGPLVCGDTAVGVTAFGDPEICNSHERPEVYIKISAYIKWICSIIRKVE